MSEVTNQPNDNTEVNDSILDDILGAAPAPTSTPETEQVSEDEKQQEETHVLKPGAKYTAAGAKIVDDMGNYNTQI